MTLPEIIRAVQKEIHVTTDGKAGPETWGALYRRLVQHDATSPAVSDVSTVDARSEKAIQTLHARVRPLARALVQAAAAQGLKIKVTSGLRTYAEQDALYAQGRTRPGQKVTNARAGHSNHNFGIAFDVTLWDKETDLPVWESPAYKAIGALGAQLGLEWGGNWTTIRDEPHFQLRPVWANGQSESAMLAELRRRKDAGKDAFA